MPYKILPTKEFEKDFRKIDAFMQDRIKKKSQKLLRIQQDINNCIII